MCFVNLFQWLTLCLIPDATYRQRTPLNVVAAEHIRNAVIQIAEPCVEDIELRRRPDVAELSNAQEIPKAEAETTGKRRKSAAVCCSFVWTYP